MCNKIRVLACLVVILLSLSSLSTTHKLTSQMLNPMDEANPSGIAFEYLLEDPDINQEPEVLINGTSDEFSSSYHSISGENNDSYIELTWNHTANTKLDYVGQDDLEIMPDYNDFIYMYQEWEWPFEEMPKDAEIRFNVSTFLTGNFANYSSSGNLMFREYVWVIDPTGNWIRLYESREAIYSELVVEKRVSLNYFAMKDIFEGMVEEDDVQEDPTDIAKIAIGLAPTYRFESFLGTEPWTFYNGLVSVRISSMEFSTYRIVEPDVETHLTPQYNQSYGVVFGDVYPQATTNTTTPLTNFIKAMTSDPAGNLYLTGETYVPYVLREQTNVSQSHQFLIKYNANLEQLWAVKDNNLSRGRAITFHDGNIYTAGFYYYDEPSYRDLLVTKWTSNGDKVWETEWGGTYDQAGVAIGVHSDGSVYVIASDFNYRGPTLSDCYDNTSLLCFDNSGTLQWSRSIQWSTQHDSPGEMRVYDSQIFYSFWGNSQVLDLDGNTIWSNYTGIAVGDDAGAVYGVNDRIDHLEITKRNPTGEIVWNESFAIEYPNDYFEWLCPLDIAVTTSQGLVVLLQAQHYDNCYFVIQYNLEGNLLNSWTIGDENWPNYGLGSLYIEVSSTDRLYCGYSLGDVYVECYILKEESVFFGSQNLLLFLGVAGGIVVIVVIGVYIFRKRKL